MGGVPADGRGFGTRWSLSSLPTWTILWFYETEIYPVDTFHLVNESHRCNHHQQKWVKIILCRFFLDLDSVNSFIWKNGGIIDFNIILLIIKMAAFLNRNFTIGFLNVKYILVNWFVVNLWITWVSALPPSPSYCLSLSPNPTWFSLYSVCWSGGQFWSKWACDFLNLDLPFIVTVCVF